MTKKSEKKDITTKGLFDDKLTGLPEHPEHKKKKGKLQHPDPGSTIPILSECNSEKIYGGLTIDELTEEFFKMAKGYNAEFSPEAWNGIGVMVFKTDELSKIFDLLSAMGELQKKRLFNSVFKIGIMWVREDTLFHSVSISLPGKVLKASKG